MSDRPIRRKKRPNPRDELNARLSSLVGRLELAVEKLERMANEEEHDTIEQR